MRKGLWLWSASALAAGGMALTAGLAEDLVPRKMPPISSAVPAIEKPAGVVGRRLPDAFLPSDEAEPADEAEETPKPYVRTPSATKPAAKAPRKVDDLFEEVNEPAPRDAEDLPGPAGTGPKDLHPLEAVIEVEDGPSRVVPAQYETEKGTRAPVQPASHATPSPKSAPPAKKSPEPIPAPKAAPVPERIPAPLAAAAKPAAPERVIANSEPPCVSVKWLPSGELSVGQETVYHLVVTNEGHGAASDCEVHAYFPRTARLLKADPQPSSSRDHLVWSLPTLAAGEEKRFAITLMPLARGELATNATVKYATGSVIAAQVTEPQLAIALKGASQAMVGEVVTHTVTVSNKGNGTARDVVVRATIPAGLESAIAKGKLYQVPVGSLAAGETREVRLQLAAVGSGEQIVAVQANGSGDLECEAQAKITVIAPKLEIAATGPSLRFANRHARYQVTAANKGAAATNNVRLIHHVPAGFEFVKADGGGTFDPASRTVTWFVGHLEAGKAVTANVELTARELGAHSHRMQVTGEGVTAAETKLETKVDGTAALMMEVVDLDDPVEVGSQTAYEIRVRNDGSKGAENVAVVCELPAGLTLVGCEGATKHTVEKGRIVFAPVAALAPQKSLKFRVQVEGKAAGQMRFRTSLTSASITEPVVVEELTKFYAD